VKLPKSGGLTSVGACLDKLVSARRITRAAADQAKAVHAAMASGIEAKGGISPTSADAAAALEAAKVMLEFAQAKKARLAKIATIQSQVAAEVAAHPKGAAWGATAKITFDPYGSGLRNVETQTQVVERRLFQHMNDALEAFRSKLPGTSADVAGGRKMVQELRGVDTGDQTAKVAADGFCKTVELGVKLFRDAGGMLHELGDWRSPQFWEPDRVRKFGDEFERDLMAAYDRGALEVFDAKVYAPAAGRERAQAIVRDAYDAIRLEKGAGGSGGGGFNTTVRAFRFRDDAAGNAAFFDLMDKYGPGTNGYLDMTIGHVKGMAREIGLMQILGPDHAATAAMLKEQVRQFEADKGFGYKLSPGRAFASPRAFERMYKAVTGELNGVANSVVAAGFANARALASAANLGGAVVSAVPGDSVTASFAAHYNGIDATRVVARALAETLTEDATKRAVAARLNVTSQALMENILRGQRFDDEVLPANLIGKATDFIMRAQGLTRWTNVIKRAFEMEFLGLIAEQSSKRFAALDPKFRGFLERYRFDPAQWDELRLAPLADIDGARFFDVEAVGNRDLGDKLLSAIYEERRFAVIEGSARTTQLAMDQRGTITGEFFRSTLQFKSFPLTMIMTHGARLWIDSGAPGGAARAASFLVASTAAGALVVQAKSILSGRDPRDMSDPKFWAAAGLAGGGAGIYGDLLNSAVTKGGQGLAETLTGPIIGQGLNAIDTLRAGTKNAIDEVRGEPAPEGNPGRAAVRTAKKWIPGSNLWYTRLAVDRLIYDQIQQAVDPQWRDSFRRMKKRAKDDYGQRFFWGPGEDAPSRAPDLGAALGQ
jgi:hypothetical protein